MLSNGKPLLFYTSVTNWPLYIKPPYTLREEPNPHEYQTYLFYLLTYILTYLLTHIHTYILTYSHTYIHTYLLTYIRTYLLAYIHTYLLIYLLREVQSFLRN
jgi:hypothetical protein